MEDSDLDVESGEKAEASREGRLDAETTKEDTANTWATMKDAVGAVVAELAGRSTTANCGS